jgi:hypothetical protein
LIGSRGRSRRLTSSTASLWAAVRLRVWPERYVLASLPPALLREGARLLGTATGFAALVAEGDEVSLTIEQELWERSPLRRRARGAQTLLRAVTFDLALAPEVCGFLAPAAVELAAAGVSIVPQCGYRKDHLLVQESSLVPATQALERLIATARRQVVESRGRKGKLP